MNKNLQQAQDIFLNKVNQICNKFGLNNIMAQLYALLYLNSNPMSLNDMTERLKISKASVSVNIRALERYGAVRQIWIKGSRRDFYEADTDIVKVIKDRVHSIVQKRASEIDEMIHSSYQAILPNAAYDLKEEDVVIFKQRLDRLRSLQEKVRFFINFLDSDLINNILPEKDTENYRKSTPLTKTELMV